MQQSKVSPNLNKPARPKSSFLSRILNNHTSASATTETTGNNSDNEEANKINNNKNDYISNKLEIRDRDHYMMNSSFSTPTNTGSYSQLSNNNVGDSPEIIIDNKNCDDNNNHDIQIPNRRQSHLYTPFHNNSNDITTTTNNMNSEYYHSKRRSYYTSQLSPVDANISNSSLTRSATWQPSSSLSANEYHNNSNTPGNSSNQHMTIPNAEIIPARRTSRNYANNPEIQAKLDAMLNSERTFYLSNAIHNNNTDPNNDNSNNMYRRSTTPGNRIS